MRTFPIIVGRASEAYHPAMPSRLRGIVTALVWSLAVIVSIAAARYFFESPPFLRPPQPAWLPQGPESEAAANVAPYMFENHRLLFRLHIACGITAMTLGLFQFIAALRRARPAIHRLLGFSYVTAVVLGGASGFPLAFYILDAVPDRMRADMYVAVIFTVSASIWSWVLNAAVAEWLVRRRRGSIEMTGGTDALHAPA